MYNVKKSYAAALLIGVLLSASPQLLFSSQIMNAVDIHSGVWSAIPFSNHPERIELREDSLRDRVKVVWDEWGVPHIFASKDEDLLYVFGYVQAMDRLWQMDLLRRLAQGRLSEIVGEPAFENDKFFRTISLGRAASAVLSAASPNLLKLLERYSEGVNDFIKGNPEKLPIEYKLLGVAPELWSPLDSGAVGRLISWGLTGSFSDLAIDQLFQRYGNELLDAIGLMKRPNTIITVPTSQLTSQIVTGSILSTINSQPTTDDYSGLVGWLVASDISKQIFGGGFASNNWVLAGSLTDTGRPILANDPHLSHVVPPIWYEAHFVVGNTVNVRGVTLPGVPIIILGRNDRIAWGFTNVGADVIDFYKYRFSADGKQYYYVDKWEDTERVEEVIKVKSGIGVEARKILVENTRHGPIVERDGKKLAVRWTGHMATGELSALYKMNRARNIDEFVGAIRDWHVPAQNIIYADIEGKIGYWAAGKYPIRSSGAPYMILDGSAGQGEWTGFVPFDEIPKLINPESGFVATANNMPVGSDYRYYLGYSWADRFRIERIRELIKRLSPLSVDEVKLIQNDVELVSGRVFLPLLLNRLKEIAGFGFQLSRARPAIEILSQWDHLMAQDAVAPTIMDRWIRELQDVVWRPILEEAGMKEFSAQAFPLEYLEKLVRENNVRWLRRPVGELFEFAFMKVLSDLGNELGEDISRWQWGRVHRYRINHPLGEVLPWLNYPAKPASGGHDTVNPASGLDVSSGASWRQVVSLGSDKSFSVIPGGQSGHRFSKHWDDQLDMWMKGQYKEMTMPISPDEIKEVEAVAIFSPAS